MRNRMGKLCLIGSAVVIGLLAMLLVVSLVAAQAAEPTYGSANVDGDSAEWSLAEDWFADMHRAWNISKTIESRLYLRYKCGSETVTGTLYVLVLPTEGVPIQVATEESWVKIDGVKLVDDQFGDDNLTPDFHWIGLSEDESTATGWEASGFLSEGTYTLSTHAQVWDVEEQTSGVVIPLILDCPPTAVTVTGFTGHNAPASEGDDWMSGWMETFLLLMGLIVVAGLAGWARRRYTGK